MREHTTPLDVSLPISGNLTDDLVRHAGERPGAPCVSRRTADGWHDVSAHAFLTAVRGVAAGLLAAGVSRGERVALMSSTRYEWTLLDYAVWYVGAVTVPVYVTAAEDQVAWILTDSGATTVLVESATQRDRILRAAAASPPSRLWTIDGTAEEDPAVELLTRLGATVPAPDLEQRRSAIGSDDLATVIYTSGTTGRPRGCMLTHGNFLVELAVTIEELHELFEDEDASTLLFLPMAHVFARIIQVGAIRAGVRLGHSAGTGTLAEDLADFRPSFVLGVPRVFEKLFNAASQQAAAEGRGRSFDRAVDVAIAFSRAQEQGRVGPLLRLRHAAYDRLVYGRLRAVLGGRCRYAVSGGAALGERLGHFYRGIGVPVLEGYGLTETTGAVTVNLPDGVRIGTVGRPVPGTTVRVSDDGELLVRGGQVLRGYWNGPRDGDAELEDGWLHTGDLGEIDGEGFVRVTGRRKEMLVTAGGKNVAPGPLEDRLRAHPLVGQCMVVGDGRPYVAAVVTLDPEGLAAWASLRGTSTVLASAPGDPDLRSELQAAVDAVNRTVSQAESIRRFTVLGVEWTEEGGHLTPSLKLRRTVVVREFRREIEQLYQD